MKEYIERAKVLESLGYEENRRGDVLPGSTFDIILQEPAADVAPVRHGRWDKPVPGDGEPYCSECHAEQPWFYGYGYYEPDYCPNCGARMEKEEQS